jgi:uncharacterized membrane protein HdeD (DUF308 family)
MFSMLKRNWWMVALRGLLAVIFGVLALVWPGLTLEVLVIFFGAYVLVDGLFTLFTALMRDRMTPAPWWLLLIEGLLGIGAGILTFIWPGITALTLFYVIAAWAVITGIIEVIGAIQLRQAIEGEWLLGLNGVLSVIFGILLMIWPATGLLTLIWLIGAYAIFFGIVMIALGFRLRSWGEHDAQPRPSQHQSFA